MTVEQAVESADLRVLLMALHHVSGDERWLAPPFTPRRDVRIIADESAGLSDAAAAEIRSEAARMFGTEPRLGIPGDEHLLRMMSVCLGHDVPAEYVCMMKEEMGFVSRDVAAPTHTEFAEGLDALVVGAGPSGIAMSVRLQRLGLRHVLVEKATSVGGVWRENTYPGCAVDTPNHSYSFSFAEPNAWSRFFAPQHELRDYMQRTADDFGVTPLVRFSTTVKSMQWIDGANRWEVELEGPAGTTRETFSFVISAVGQLHIPKTPSILGLSDFTGTMFHSARWPDGLSLAGKRVGIIGTGATAMQIVPAIVDQVAGLTVFQRSAQWARPVERYHDPIPAGVQWLLANYPYYAQWYRFTMTWRFADGLHPYIQKDPAWPHPERAVNKRNDVHREEMLVHMLNELGDRDDLVAKCVPDYPPYGKRILLDNGWFAALRRPHVELVDDSIERADGSAIITKNGGRHDVDVLVLATGFEVTRMAANLNVTGRDGARLDEVWGDGNPFAYLGISVPGFPNFFCMQGPNTGLGHGGSAIFQSECQARHITSCIAAMIERRVPRVEVTEQATAENVAATDAAHEQMIWTHPGMSTYYRNGAGRVITVMPWRLVDYWSMTHDVDHGAYRFG